MTTDRTRPSTLFDTHGDGTSRTTDGRLQVATDGSCLGNPGPGGWAFYVDQTRWAAGGTRDTTNNRMELLAVLRALQTFDEPLNIRLDSAYVKNALTKWLAGWKRRNWTTSSGKPVANQDLIRQLDQALQGRDVTFEWVRGHAGDPQNEAADDRAREAATAIRDNTTVNQGPCTPAEAA